MEKIGNVFYSLCSSANSSELQEVQTKMAPLLSLHSNYCFTLPGLFEKIEILHNTKDSTSLQLTSEQIRLIERIYTDFTRAGANFDEKSKEEYKNIKVCVVSCVFGSAYHVLLCK